MCISGGRVIPAEPVRPASGETSGAVSSPLQGCESTHQSVDS